MQPKNESRNLSLTSKPRPSHTCYVPATRDANMQQVDFIFSRDNPLSKASNLLPTDPIAVAYALPGSSISTWQVGGFEGGIMPDTGLRKPEVAMGERN